MITTPVSEVGKVQMATFSRPSTLNEACTMLATSSFQVINGGTGIMSTLAEGLAPGRLLDLSRLNELKGIEIRGEYVRIGGRVTWREIALANLPPSFDTLKQAARGVGSIQIRNIGTIAGNVCMASSSADGVPPLLALDAKIELVSMAGRRDIPLSHFIVGDKSTVRRPDEIVAAIVIPRRSDVGLSVFLKVGARSLMTSSIVMVAAILARGATDRVEHARIAVGSCSAVAQRLPELERALVGAVAKPGLSELAGPNHLVMLAPKDDIRASAAYRRDAALTLIRRALDACVGGR
jgi:CO/xanthine dehydrogenase FAD-binding subunit